MTIKETLDRYNIPYKMLTEDSVRFSVVLKSRFTVQRAKRSFIKHNHKLTGEKHSVGGYELTGIVNQEKA